MRYIFTVETSADLPDLGCVIGAFIPNDADFPDFPVGSPLLLQIPDGEPLDSLAKGFPMANIGSKVGHFHFTIQLPTGLSAGDVPAETKVFLKTQEKD